MFPKTAATLICLSLTTVGSLWADVTISLHDAVRQGKVKVEVKSLGGAAGKTVRVEVQRLVPDTVRIAVTPGTVLVNSVNTEQNIAVGRLLGEFTRDNMYRKENVMVLADQKTHSFLLEVYCLDYAKKRGLRRGGVLQLALPDQRVARILNPPEGLNPTLGAIQIAIWMDREGISVEEAVRRTKEKITEVDIQVARQLLAHAEKTGIESIPDDMPVSVRVHVEKLFSSDPKIRSTAGQELARLGLQAQSAASFLTANLLDRSSDKPLPANVVSVDAAIETAADALERLRMPGLAPLIESLRDGSTGSAADDMTRAAQGILGDLVFDRLLGRLKSSRATARASAARILGGTGNQRAVLPLIELLGDDNQQVRDAAAEALKSLTGKDFGSDIQQWKQWWNDR